LASFARRFGGGTRPSVPVVAGPLPDDRARIGEQSEQLAIVVDRDHRYTEAYAVQIVSA
jgi:hypothetical protein